MKKYCLAIALVALLALVGCAEHEHSWKEEVVKKATCGASGLKVYTCEVCEATREEEIPATGEHSYELKTLKEADCVNDGSKQEVCSVCGAKGSPEVIEAAHKYDSSGKCTVCHNSKVEIEKAVARVGLKYYETLDGLFEKEKGGVIEVILLKDAELSIAPWKADAGNKYVLGSDSTSRISIIGNGKNLSFNRTNSDWNYVILANEDAILEISDATLYGTGYGSNTGTWNTHDIYFNCKVSLKNVVSKNAIALGMDATFEHVEISDKDVLSDVYMLWIVANGQSVTLKDCTIDGKSSVEGKSNRAIAIKDQYVAEANRKSVALSVKDTVISSDKKAAILVTSTAGASIEIDNVDISNTPDSVNAVWIDNGSSYGEAIRDKVIVSGGTAIIGK